MMKLLTIVAIAGIVSCKEQRPPQQSNIASTITIYRITPEGDKEMELVKQLDEHGNAHTVTDYMAGEVYLWHWNQFDVDGNILLGETASCENCDRSSTHYEYEQGRLIRRWDEEKEATFEYDAAGNKTLELEVFTESKLLRRFKLMDYADGNMIRKRSYDLSADNVAAEGLSLDSLLAAGVQPYHVIESFYNEDGMMTESRYSGAVSDWFQVHKHFYDEQGRPIKVEYSSRAGESGGSRIYEYSP